MGPSNATKKNLSISQVSLLAGYSRYFVIPYYTFPNNSILGIIQLNKNECMLTVKIIMFLGSKVRRVRKADTFTAI
jgi:hypothetical protein